MRYLGIVGKNEEYPVHYEVLSGLSLLISRSGKNRNTEVIAREKSRKKRPYVARSCVLHKVIFLILSWFFSGYHILPFWGYVGLPWNTPQLFPLFCLCCKQCDLRSLSCNFVPFCLTNLCCLHGLQGNCSQKCSQWLFVTTNNLPLKNHWGIY